MCNAFYFGTVFVSCLHVIATRKTRCTSSSNSKAPWMRGIVPRSVTARDEQRSGLPTSMVRLGPHLRNIARELHPTCVDAAHARCGRSRRRRPASRRLRRPIDGQAPRSGYSTSLTSLEKLFRPGRSALAMLRSATGRCWLGGARHPLSNSFTKIARALFATPCKNVYRRY